MYQPPFSITNEMLKQSISIAEKLGKITSFESLKRMPVLRRNNKIQSVHSSLVIEANSLSLEQVKDCIAGKMVIGPQKEIQEVKNAYQAYEMMSEINPFSQADLLKIHGIFTHLTCEESGRYRNHAEGILDGEKVVFVAPSQEMVPHLMNDLFEWLNNDTETPLLIKSCVFHYEFVFIHPFGDGNGRTVRFWQNALLSQWNPIFEFIPIESQIQKYQAEYYDAISRCNIAGNSTFFVEFMLKMIDETLEEVMSTLSREAKNISDQVNHLYEVMEDDMPLSANELMNRLVIKSKETLRATYLNPAIENGLVQMTLADKPNSKNQKYIKTLY